MIITEIINKYRGKISHLDLELLIAHSLGKTREFVLTYPKKTISKKQEVTIKKSIARRAKSEPIAYITGHKEFYGLDFITNKNTLIPRPETELLVEEVLKLNPKNNIIADIGTGSGNIIISLAKNISSKNYYFGIDISKEALRVAKKNAKNHNVDKKIRFFIGDLLSPFIENCKLKIENSTLVTVANLPYLSKEIYSSVSADVKKYEPISALYSSEAGLSHYHKLLKQIYDISKNYELKSIICIFEISPEQKQTIVKLVKKIFPSTKITFIKDLARKWRVCKIEI